MSLFFLHKVCLNLFFNQQAYHRASSLSSVQRLCVSKITLAGGLAWLSTFPCSRRSTHPKMFFLGCVFWWRKYAYTYYLRCTHLPKWTQKGCAVICFIGKTRVYLKSETTYKSSISVIVKLGNLIIQSKALEARILTQILKIGHVNQAKKNKSHLTLLNLFLESTFVSSQFQEKVSRLCPHHH